MPPTSDRQAEGWVIQPHIHAATVIRRVAERPHRRPETKAALLLAASLILSAEVEVEWNLIHPNGRPWFQPWSEHESEMREESQRHPDWPLVSRIRVTVPDAVGAWVGARGEVGG